MSLNPFAPTTDYPSMLNKIAVYTFAVGIAMTWVLRSQIWPVEVFLMRFDLPVQLMGNKISLGYILPAFLVALLFRIFKMHDRLSDVFGIRKRFDVNEILAPLSKGAGVAFTMPMRGRATSRRDSLMAKVFYAYASGTKGHAKIDPHHVTMALDQWSWFWILAEAVLLMAVAGVALLIAAAYKAAIWLFGICAIILIILRLTRSGRANYARAQVDAILADPTRRAEVAAVFRAL